ncbi:response regulator [Xanthobacteraceae bacterium A53D]
MDGSKRILIVEDEFLVALGLEDSLRSLGYAVVGPVGSLREAQRLAESAQMDAAILDVDLRGELVFPAADVLSERGIPMIFCSGRLGVSNFPERFNDARKVPKPYNSAGIAAALRDILDDDDGSPGPDRHSGPDQSAAF